jgi:hypothetical protein
LLLGRWIEVSICTVQVNYGLHVQN